MNSVAVYAHSCSMCAFFQIEILKEGYNW